MVFAIKKKIYLRERRAAIIIQKNTRKRICLKKYENILKKVIVIQSWYKKCNFDYRVKCIIRIQQFYRDQKQRIFMKKKLIQQHQWEMMTKTWEEQEKKRLEDNRLRVEKLNKEHEEKLEKLKREEEEFLKKIEMEKIKRKREEEKIKMEQLKKEKVIEKRSRELEEKAKQLKLDNERFRHSIQNNVENKIKMAAQMEKLIIQNKRMQLQMKRMVEMRNEEKNCVIS